MKESLTLLVTLKDRHEFTRRLCEYLSRIKYPFHVFFADGSISDDNEHYFKSLGNQNFEYTYKRYSQDISLLNYYEKCYQAVRDIKTPYVMMADNDDFPIPEGQLRAVQFLEKNIDFCGCNGRVAGISFYPDTSEPYGARCLFHQYYCQTMDVPVLLNQVSAIDRINSYLSHFYSIFYGIFRRDTLETTFFLTKDLNFSELGIHELFFSYMQLTQGKMHSIDTITYIRQKGSSQSAASQKDWFYRLFYTNWLEDSRKAISTVAEHIAQVEHKDPVACDEILYAQFVDRMRNRYVQAQPKTLTCHQLGGIFFSQLFKRAPSFAEKLSARLYLDKPSLACIGAFCREEAH